MRIFLQLLLPGKLKKGICRVLLSAILLPGIIFVLLLGCNSQSIEQGKKVENIKAFAKLYGYVRWFHPSDEAQQIDWDRFACYGVKTVENAPNSGALRDSLLKLFLPIAPALEIYNGSEKHDFDISKITPQDTAGFYPVYWQHSGVALNNTPARVYSSVRIHRIKSNEYKNVPAIFKEIDASNYLGKTLELSFEVKAEKGAQANLMFDGLTRDEYFTISKYNNLTSYKNTNWEKKTITCNIKPDDMLIYFALNEINGANVFIKNICISEIGENEERKVIFKSDLYDADESAGIEIKENTPFEIKTVSADNSGRYLSVKFNPGYSAFRHHPVFGELAEKKIHPGLFVHLPVVLMADGNYTFPAADKESLRALQNKVIMQHDSGCSQNLGSLVIVWNVIQHFFPYFDEVDVDWEKEFTTALNEIYEGQDFQKILEKFTAKLNDGHVGIVPPAYKKVYALPVKWEWIGKNLIITEVFEQNIHLLPGTIVNQIANKKTKDYFSEIEQYIPAPTLGFLRNRSESISLFGTPGDSLKLNVVNPDGTKADHYLKYSMHPSEHYNKLLNKTKCKILKDSIYYLNLDQISMPEIDSLMPELVSCKGLICDLRGYPNHNSELLNHLLTRKDTVDNWMKIPQIVYPDRKSIEFAGQGWQMAPKSPHIKAPVVFITDGNAISYAESVLLIVKHYNLATIVGQPSAGTNGDVNSIKLPNGFKLNFTGKKVTNGDGSRHFGVGVLPDVYVEKTIEGVLNGRDEFLGKALEVIGYN